MTSPSSTSTITGAISRSEEHTSELQSPCNLVCRLLLEKKKKKKVDELQDKLKDANNQLFRATTEYQTMKATYDQDPYDFEASRANNLPSAAKKCEVATE